MSVFKKVRMPYVTTMVQAKTAEAVFCKIRNAVADGTEAVGLQLEMLEGTDRTEETIFRCMEAAEGKPLYVTNYRTHENAGRSDEDLMNELIAYLKYGALLLDMMGDAFSLAPEELTMDPKAVGLQRKFIDEVHARGGQILMSSHIYTWRSPERVLEIAHAQECRGADIVKIVTGADTEEEELSNFGICRLLQKELKTPFLFLSCGKYGKLHRLIGPALGACMWLCVREYDAFTTEIQPVLANVLKVKSALKL